MLSSSMFVAARSLRNVGRGSGAIRSMSVIILSDTVAVEKFRQINSKSLLYFTASWCGPCRMIAPLVDDMSKVYPDVAFGKVDVDDNSDVAMDFDVSSVPTFVLFDGENPTKKISGADPTKLEEAVKELQGKE